MRLTNKTVVFSVVLALLTACSSAQKSSNPAEKGSVPFVYIKGTHLIVIPVRINDSIDARFILDTGGGLNLISNTLCDRIGCVIQGSYTGKRMSGQKLIVPLSTVGALSVAGHRQEKAPVGVWDVKGFLPSTPEFANIEGFVSLRFFEKLPFSMDYMTKKLIFENASTLAQREKDGQVVEAKRVGTAVDELTIKIPIKIGEKAYFAEIDTGSDSLILNKKFMPQLGVNPKSNKVKRVSSKDETGHSYVRYFTKISGPVYPGGIAALKQTDLRVMFQDIIYDAIVGDDFLRQFVVTYDLPNWQMVFSR